MRDVRPVALLALALVAVSGCASDLPVGNVVTFTQVTAIEMEVVGDAPRASPAPGEDLDVLVRVAFPAEKKPISWAFLACIPEATSTGIPLCTDVPTLVAQQLTPAMGDPSFIVSVPDAATIGSATQLLMVGAVCADGEIALPSAIDLANLDLGSLTVPCANGSLDGVVLTTPIFLQTASFSNQNPAFEQLFFASSPWTDIAPPDAPEQGCLGSGVRVISLAGVINGNALTVGFTAAAGSREQYVADVGDPPVPTDFTENLQISEYCTAGEFDRTFSFIEDDTLAASVDWVLPTDPPDDGQLVRFYFGMRDLRGGQDFLERALCIVP